MKRLLLGTWQLPSGNTVEAFLDIMPGDTPHYEARCEWQDFPVAPEDQEYYRQHIAPEIYEKLAEHLSPGKKMLVIQT